MKKFWLIWREDGSSPQRKHESEQSARQEAERLARQHPGIAFHVLESMGHAIKREVDWVEAVEGVF